MFFYMGTIMAIVQGKIEQQIRQSTQMVSVGQKNKFKCFYTMNKGLQKLIVH